jgi:predicted DCC family thiol-disulfide oxidoreductase YuxK
MPWSPQPAAGLPDLIVFDGDCVLCSHWARWVDARDQARRFRFVAVQSEAGRGLAGRFGIDADAPQSNVLVMDKIAYFKSDAIHVLLASLPHWRWARRIGLAPRAWRDWVYDRVARSRYAVFGRRKDCLAPDGGVRARLVHTSAELAALG